MLDIDLAHGTDLVAPRLTSAAFMSFGLAVGRGVVEIPSASVQALVARESGAPR